MQGKSLSIREKKKKTLEVPPLYIQWEKKLTDPKGGSKIRFEKKWFTSKQEASDRTNGKEKQNRLVRQKKKKPKPTKKGRPDGRETVPLLSERRSIYRGGGDRCLSPSEGGKRIFKGGSSVTQKSRRLPSFR